MTQKTVITGLYIGFLWHLVFKRKHEFLIAKANPKGYTLHYLPHVTLLV